MKLEAGKLYQTRDGRKCFVATCHDRSILHFPFIGLIEGHRFSLSFAEDGKYEGKDYDFDIISEWPSTPAKNPVIYDRSLLPAWANKAIAMDSDGSWYCYAEIPNIGDYHWDDEAEVDAERIRKQFIPQWSGDWKDSLLVFEEPTI